MCLQKNIRQLILYLIIVFRIKCIGWSIKEQNELHEHIDFLNNNEKIDYETLLNYFAKK